MTLTSVIYFIIVIAIAAIFFGVIILRQKSKGKKVLNQLTDFAKANDCQISESELFNSQLIGLDANNAKLFFIKLTDNSQQVINLMKIQKCRVNEHARIVNSGKAKQQVTDLMELILVPKDSKEEPVKLEFYNIEKGDFQLTGEHEFMEKWAAKINALIN